MLSSKIKVKQFIKSYPKCKGILYNYIKKYENLIIEQENDLITEELIDDAKELCKYDISKFKKSILSGF